LEKDIKSDDFKLETDYDKTASDPKFFDRYQAKKSDLDSLMEEWESLQEELEGFNN
jgi:ATP-binding cassette subfamily F protein 3